MPRLLLFLLCLAPAVRAERVLLEPAFSIHRDSGGIKDLAISRTGTWVALTIGAGPNVPPDAVEVWRAGAQAPSVVLDAATLPAHLPPSAKPASPGERSVVVALAFLPDDRLVVVSANRFASRLTRGLDAWTLVDPATGGRTELAGDRGLPAICDRRIVEWRRTSVGRATQVDVYDLDAKSLARSSPWTVVEGAEGRAEAPTAVAGLRLHGFRNCFQTLVASPDESLVDGEPHELVTLDRIGAPVKRRLDGDAADVASSGLLNVFTLAPLSLRWVDGYARPFANPPIQHLDANGKAHVVRFSEEGGADTDGKGRWASTALGPQLGGRVIFRGRELRLGAEGGKPEQTDVYVLSGDRARLVGRLPGKAESLPLASGQTHFALVRSDTTVEVFLLPK